MPPPSTMVTLPPAIRACLFDLDGVLTSTARIHAAAWKDAFDAYLTERSLRTGLPFTPFDALHDYDLYVDGRPRLDGVRSFLDGRGIVRPPEDDLAVSERKNALVLGLIRERGVEAYPGSRRFLDAVESAGLGMAVVSSSANTREVLASVGLEHRFAVRIDGVVAAREGIPGKPAPDTFLAAARALGVAPAEAAVFEDALAGVAAGRAGGFGWVVGVDRTGQADALRAQGADVVVADLAELVASP